MAVNAGRAMIKVYADNTALARGLKHAQAKLRAFSAGVARIGGALMAASAAGIAPLLFATRQFATFGDQVDKMSKRTGIGAAALSEIAFAAEQGGAALADVEKAVRRMQRTVLDAAQGTKEAKDALDGLGLSLGELSALAPEDQFTLILDRLKGIADPTIRAATAMEVFGRSGTAMLPMIQDFAALRKEARDLGITLTQEDATAAAALTDAMNRVRRTIKAVSVAVGGALAPMLTAMATSIASVIARAAKWIRQNRELVVTVAKIAAVVGLAGAALVALGGAGFALSTVIGGLATLVGGAVAVIGAMVGIVATLLSPVVLATAAVVAWGGALLYTSSIGGRALAWLGEQFHVLMGVAVAAWQGIANALAAGDIALAARILWLTLKTAWLSGTEQLRKSWTEFADAFQRIGADAFYGALRLMASAWATMRELWADTVAALSTTWTNFGAVVLNGWHAVQGALTKGFLKIMSIWNKNIDFKASAKRIDAETASKIRAVDAERAASVSASKAKHTKDTDRIAADLAAAILGIDTQAGKARAERDAAFALELAETEAALGKAKDEWHAALDAAGKKAAETANAAKAKADAAGGAAPGGGMAKDRLRAATEAIGTFSARGLSGMGYGSSAADRTATAAEGTKDLLKRLVAKTESDGLKVKLSMT